MILCDDCEFNDDPGMICQKNCQSYWDEEDCPYWKKKAEG